jgi:hypothetical protein
VISRVTPGVLAVLAAGSCVLALVSQCHTTGHYVALVKSADVWLLYEDDSVEPVPDSTVQQTFGAASDYTVGFCPLCKVRVCVKCACTSSPVWPDTEGCCSCRQRQILRHAQLA